MKNFRKRSGLSQLELEMRIDGSPGMISRIENGKVNPTKETLLTVAKELDLKAIETANLFDIELNIKSKRQESISTLLRNQFISDEAKVLLDTLAIKILNKLDLVAGFVGSSLSRADLKQNIAQLMYISESKIPRLALKNQ
ncbi:MAG: helix-turn-helix transcriptional regulator [Candidatus Dojkabacteria bacterium]|nr:helix-turn-helix transcriptional regulator [Candidatus Dojkabacteria bacterium]